MNSLQTTEMVSLEDYNSDFPIWKPIRFLQYSSSLKEILRTLLLLNMRFTSLFKFLPRDILFILFSVLEEITKPFHDSLLLSHLHQCTLSQWVPKVKKWKLLYRASRDGFSHSSFHSLCDFKGATYSIIKANGFLFGGFTFLSWESRNWMYRNEKERAFIFTLTNPHNIPPTQYFPKNENSTKIFDYSLYGPCFGYYDIVVDFDNKNFHYFPISFIDTTRKGRLTFTGIWKDWEVEELEVFGLYNPSVLDN
jgi:hypothetical protein